MSLPPRLKRSEEAKRAYPEIFSRLVPALELSDPLADEAIASLAHLPSAQGHVLIARALDGSRQVPSPLVQLIESASQLPAWLNWSRIERAGSLFFRAGVLGGITLGMRSLVYGYASPVGNKPLVLSGALEKKAERRLAETGRFVASVCSPHSMRLGAEGFRNTIHVRLMHAKVRAMALCDRRWDRETFGLPINQHDMVATVLLFSAVFTDGIRRLGVHVSAQEEEDFQHLWRWVGLVMGVREELLPKTVLEARGMARFVRLTQGAPDEDSRALVRALMNAPLRRASNERERRLARAQIATAEGLCRALLDPLTADALGLSRGASPSLLPVIRRSFTVLEHIRRRVGPVDQLAEILGTRYWTWSVERGLTEGGELFHLPSVLEGTLRAFGRRINGEPPAGESRSAEG